MHLNLKQPIDATKYDIRVLWSGLTVEPLPEDACLVEGFPIDPPDESKGWQLVSMQTFPADNGDNHRYCTLWVKPKSKAKSKAKKRKPAADAAAKSKGKPKPRTRKPRGEAATPPVPPENTETPPDAN